MARVLNARYLHFDVKFHAMLMSSNIQLAHRSFICEVNCFILKPITLRVILTSVKSLDSSMKCIVSGLDC